MSYNEQVIFLSLFIETPNMGTNAGNVNVLCAYSANRGV
ncbi:hypothetical protein CGSMWGv75712_02400 [Gardnerella vaginalis 75712]|nr:hypothetical protein CGSMWGv75712_02400 [Gardnerella vaginalis 75712]